MIGDFLYKHLGKMLVAFVGLVVLMLVLAVREEQRWARSCEAAGGVPFTPRGGRVCPPPGQAIPVR